MSSRKSYRNAKKATQKIRRGLDGLKVADENTLTEDNNDNNPVGANDSGLTPLPLVPNINRDPLFDEWEKLEVEEAAEITQKHRRTVGWKLPELLPIQVHVAAPVAGRFTREVESDIEQLNTIEAVKDLVQSSMYFELQCSNIDLLSTKFAGLMTYGPAFTFDKPTYQGTQRGLFLQEAAFKKWWLTVTKTARVPGEHVKIAVVLFEVEEAAARQVQVPDFWTNEAARILANPAKSLEWRPWEVTLEKGGRSLATFQRQQQDLRGAFARVSSKLEAAEGVAKERGASLKKVGAKEARVVLAGEKLAAAVEAAGLVGGARLVAAWRKAVGMGMGSRLAANEEEDEDEDEDEAAAAAANDNGEDDEDEEAAEEEQADVVAVVEGDSDTTSEEADNSDDSDYVA